MNTSPQALALHQLIAGPTVVSDDGAAAGRRQSGAEAAQEHGQG